MQLICFNNKILKLLFLILLFFTTSCLGTFHQLSCFAPSEYQQQRAQEFFEDAYSTRIFIIGDLGYKYFGCYYYPGDEIYYYKTIFNHGYVLVRNNKAVISVEIEKTIRNLENN